MQNKLTDLQNHLFEMIETLNDNTLKEKDLEKEIKRALAINELARKAIANGALMARCADALYGIPVSDEVPLIPKPSGETFFLDGRRKALIGAPRDDGTGGYKRSKRQPV